MENILQRVIDEFVKIVRIDSLSLKEEKMFDYIKTRLGHLPVTMEFLPYTMENTGAASGNLIVRLPANENNKPALFFDAHVDTVEPGIGIKPVVENNRIRSDGSTILGADDKAGAAAMIIALEELLSSGVRHGDISFLFTSAEEIGLTGVHHLDFSKLKADYGFVLDSHGKIGGVNVAAPHHYGYEIRVKGKASHAGIAPEQGINAIKIAAQIIESLPQGKLNKDTVANVGLIEGGKATNIIPDECIIKGEFRSHDMKEIIRLKEEITRLIEKNKKLAVDIGLSFTEMYKGFRFNKRDPIIQIVRKAIESIGLKPRFERSGGGSNTNLYNQNHIACLNLAVGMMNVHSTEEYIDCDDLENLVRLIMELVKTV